MDCGGIVYTNQHANRDFAILNSTDAMRTSPLILSPERIALTIAAARLARKNEEVCGAWTFRAPIFARFAARPRNFFLAS
jgi:hypothetical protein